MHVPVESSLKYLLRQSGNLVKVLSTGTVIFLFVPSLTQIIPISTTHARVNFAL
jgi:hypothetical protein